jgi:Fe-S-cluster containining protein
MQTQDPIPTVERLNLSVDTPLGSITIPVEVPTALIPVTAIVPLARHLSSQAQTFESQQAVSAGNTISCTKGCAACCRMLVPVSVPEAFLLYDLSQSLPPAEAERLNRQRQNTRVTLERGHLWTQLMEIAEWSTPLSDEQLDPINRDYFGLHVPCLFLENECCSIYDDRPSACRELHVTSPAEWCQEFDRKPVTPLPVMLRGSTILGLLWAELTNQPPRLIPLPVALDWAERHAHERAVARHGPALVESLMEQAYKLLWEQLPENTRQQLKDQSAKPSLPSEGGDTPRKL